MGITTGFCTVGNFGSDSRMEYTIIGNQVNLASRLESNANAQPGHILMSEETCTLVNERFECQEQPPLTVKGFSKPVRTFRLIGGVTEPGIRGQIKSAGEGYSVFLDPSAIPESEREGARAALQQALDAMK